MIYFRNMKWFYLALSIVLILLILSPFFMLSDEFKKQQADGTVYHAEYSSAVKSIDPATCGDVTSSSIQANIYEGLYCYHYLKRPLEAVPQIAEDLPEISEDGLTYTIHLKKNVLYHRNPCFGEEGNGIWETRAVNAADFLLSFKRVADYHINTGLAWAFMAGRIEGLDDYRKKTKQFKAGDFSRYEIPVSGLKALDDHTLQIRLVEPFPQFVYVLSMHVYAPVPMEAVSYWLTAKADETGKRVPVPVHERNTEFMEPEHVVGTGPYLLKTWKRKWKIHLIRNPEFRPEYYPKEGEPASDDYEGDEAAGLLVDAGKKVPFVDEIRYRFIEETYSSWMLFLGRQVDVAGIPPETFESVIGPEKELTDKWKEKNIYLKRFTDPSIFWLAFNMEDPIVGKSKALRQAICLGYDAENDIKILSNGRGVQPVNIIPSSFKGHKETGPGSYYRYDLSAAKEKIKEAKKELAGVLEEGEIPELKLDLSNGTFAVRTADFVRQQFAALGLKIKVSFNDWPTLQRKVHNKQSQMYMMGWLADYPDAENFLQLFYSGNIDKGTNNANYSNPVFDSLYQLARVMQDCPERTEMYARMANMISEDCPVFLRVAPENFILYYNWVRNIKPHPIGHGYLKYRRIDTAIRKKLGGRE